MFDLRPIDCPVCETDSSRPLGIRGGASQREGRGVQVTVVRCGRCGLVYPNPFPFPDDSQDLYGDPEDYFAGDDDESKRVAAANLVRELAAGMDSPRLLDVGAGRGEVVAAATKFRMEAVGVELSAAMCEQSAVGLFCGTIEEYAATEPGQFDVIVMNGVLEHVLDPNSLISTVARLACGRIFIDCPREPNLLTMVGNAANRVVGSRAVFNLSPTWPPFHVFGFNPSSVRALLEKHGLRIERVVVKDNRAHVPGSRVGTLVMRAANLTPWAANMNVFAASPGSPSSGLSGARG